MAPSFAAECSPGPIEAFTGFDVLWETKPRTQKTGSAVPGATAEDVGCNEFDDGIDSSSQPSVSTDSPMLKSALTAASTSDGSDCGHAVGRWANLEFDEEVDSSPEKADSVEYPFPYWDEQFNADLSNQWSASMEGQDCSSDMHGWHWVPVAVVPFSWPDVNDFTEGHTSVSDLKHVLDARKPAKGARANDELAAAWKKSKHQAGRRRAKKQAAVDGSKATSSHVTQSKGVAGREHTTIMVRNIPSGCSRAMLQAIMDARGFEGQYDFLYLPYSFDDWSILGHAFVNFLELPDAERAVAKLGGVLWPELSDKPCEVCWSKALQGLAPCIGRFRNSPVMHHSVGDQYKPMMLKNGRRCPFPEPTKQIQQVRRSSSEGPQGGLRFP